MFFGNSRPQPEDPLLAVMARFRADPRVSKTDLGVGVYRDENGRTPVLDSVKAAERRLVDQQQSKSYLGSDGDGVFLDLLRQGALGGIGAGLLGLQTPGGTGALLVAAQLLAMIDKGRRVWLGIPTWPNHRPIFEAAGLKIASYDHYDIANRRFRNDQLLDAMRRAAPGDVFVLHGCCHNPTGADLSPADWREAADLMVARNLIPVLDLAYQGLGAGWEEDVAGTQVVLERVPGALIAYSCDKNFGLYRDRVGALFIGSQVPGEAQTLWSNAVAIARRSWSMPPDHGAAVVRLILEDDQLTRTWRGEMAQMRDRIARTRNSLAAFGQVGPVDLSGLARELGMFAMLPIGAATVERLRAEFGIYMAGSGRINLAGLSLDGVSAFVDALRAVTALEFA